MRPACVSCDLVSASSRCSLPTYSSSSLSASSPAAWIIATACGVTNICPCAIGPSAWSEVTRGFAPSARLASPRARSGETRSRCRIRTASESF